jgi:hypothetical protein
MTMTDNDDDKIEQVLVDAGAKSSQELSSLNRRRILPIIKRKRENKKKQKRQRNLAPFSLTLASDNDDEVDSSDESSVDSSSDDDLVASFEEQWLRLSRSAEFSDSGNKFLNSLWQRGAGSAHRHDSNRMYSSGNAKLCLVDSSCKDETQTKKNDHDDDDDDHVEPRASESTPNINLKAWLLSRRQVSSPDNASASRRSVTPPPPPSESSWGSRWSNSLTNNMLRWRQSASEKVLRRNIDGVDDNENESKQPTRRRSSSVLLDLKF